MSRLFVSNLLEVIVVYTEEVNNDERLPEHLETYALVKAEEQRRFGFQYYREQNRDMTKSLTLKMDERYLEGAREIIVGGKLVGGKLVGGRQLPSRVIGGKIVQGKVVGGKFEGAKVEGGTRYRVVYTLSHSHGNYQSAFSKEVVVDLQQSV